MKDWFIKLNTKDRLIVLGGGSLLLIFLVYQLAWAPISAEAERLVDVVDKKKATKQWMLTTAKQIKQIRRDTGVITTNGQSLLSITDKTITSFKLKTNLKRIEPDKESSVRVWLEQASFDDIIKWLQALDSRNGIKVIDITIDKLDQAGIVDARITLAAAS